MEREVLLTGIGGQGVQLAAQVLARAAALEDRSAMVFGIYSGVMRGGNSDSSLVVADGPIQSPPVVSHAWSAIVMHHKYWEPIVAKLRPGAVVVVNSTLFEGDIDRGMHRVFDVPVTSKAVELDNGSAHMKLNLAWIYACAGDKESATKVMNEVMSDKMAYVSPVSVAQVKLALGEKDEGFALLEKARQTRDASLLYLRGSPSFVEYQSDPRWLAIERKMGLPKS